MQALEVIARYPERFEVVGLAAGRNVERLRDQVARFAPRLATIAADGPDSLRRVALESEAQILLAATDGFVAFDAVREAVERGIDVALANKELIVCAGELLVDAAARSGARLLPVDSEHSAIFQCLLGERREEVARIILTASGGPFLRESAQLIESATLARALAHPTWRMGTKNTIDSATLMNKGLEVIEASHLFGIGPERIEVVVHPQSILHGFVAFSDGSVKAQLCAPDMRVPIGYALAFPQRLPGGFASEQAAMAMLGGEPTAASLRYEMEPPDFARFPCLGLAYAALRSGGTAPTVLSAANEYAVAAFVEGAIRFGQIAEIVAATLEQSPLEEATWASVRRADSQARRLAKNLLGATLPSSGR